jgi:hypothetical protein
MWPDPFRDPRYERLPPTPEEVEAWASREHERRQAWCAGPTQGEQDEWARRCRRRAALGLAESTLGPSEEEIAEWAEREHKRRQAWRAGPTSQEKRDWARASGRRGLPWLSEPDLPATEEEINAWAGQERRRREAWLAGPTEEEKQRWTRRQTGSGWDDVESALTMGPELVDLAADAVYAFSRAPFILWSSFLRSARMVDRQLYQPPRRHRVRF